MLLKPSDGLIPSFPVVNVFALCMTRYTPLVLLWVSPMLERTLPWPTDVMTLFFGPRAIFTLPFIMFLATPAMLGTNALTVRPPWVQEASFPMTTFRLACLADDS